jgi:hypothetical protein
MSEADLLVLNRGLKPRVTWGELGVSAGGCLIVIFWSQPPVTRGLHRLDANNRFKMGGFMTWGYLPRGNPGLDPGSARPRVSQTSEADSLDN